MAILKEFFNDPVIFFSFTGLAVLLGIGGFYVYYFISKINHEE